MEVALKSTTERLLSSALAGVTQSTTAGPPSKTECTLVQKKRGFNVFRFEYLKCQVVSDPASGRPSESWPTPGCFRPPQASSAPCTTAGVRRSVE
ncbi:hypothetical protein KFL_000210540 [Klebsormidium nitens]|uniref:Uncharacterized protein n=1 Tax=Klebsormidium nitens TaxID=105231 RepID=A0A1Y1HQU5_KLENI|nr:hypothetical protein KFL_000210540 [Klebsormidium nitens]|eukprot:GAQ78966.1 hypothetical protein KFL_000210540 [Klebsormidium nitens]